VVHHGVADEDDFDDLRLPAGCKACDELAQRGAHAFGQIVAVERGANAAHDVRAKSGLGIEQGFDAEDVAGSKIDDLSGDGGGAEVDSDAQARFFFGGFPPFPQRARKGSGNACCCGGRTRVGKDFHAPLAALKHERRFCTRLTGETPSNGELVGSEGGAVSAGDGERAREHAHAAAAALAGAAAGKLETVRGEAGHERATAGDVELDGERLETDADSIGGYGRSCAGRARTVAAHMASTMPSPSVART